VDLITVGAFVTEGAVQPETKYARLEGDRIAYQVLGQGPPDLVMTRGGYGHLDTAWGRIQGSPCLSARWHRFPA
jgi:hypothetical protein